MNNKSLMNIKLHLLGRALAVSLLSAPFGAVITSCVDNSDTQEEDTIAVAFDNIWPEGMDPSGILSATLNLRELNTGATYTVNPMSSTLATLPLGVYDYTGSVTVAESQGGGRYGGENAAHRRVGHYNQRCFASGPYVVLFESGRFARVFRNLRRRVAQRHGYGRLA